MKFLVEMKDSRAKRARNYVVSSSSLPAPIEGLVYVKEALMFSLQVMVNSHQVPTMYNADRSE